MAEALCSAPTTSAEFEPPGVQMRMFQTIISSGLTIKPQQRGEADLTKEEKLTILADLLRNRPGAFLMRFGNVLDGLDLDHFSGSSEYEVQYRVNDLRKHLSPAKRKTRTRNRRYKCMEELMDTDYFSMEEMRQRNPLLFRHYIGQYMSEEELAAMDSTTSDMRLSSHIMRRMRQDERREREHRQEEKEEEGQEEEDTSSDEEEEEEEGMEEGGGRGEVTETEKRHLRGEFLRAMQLSFLRGDDKDFDYSSVDTNEAYDSVEIQQRDGEDAYFDEEEPEWCSNEHESGTLDDETATDS